jgi:hypothetical protein
MLIKKVKNTIAVVAKVVQSLTNNSETDVPSVKCVNNAINGVKLDTIAILGKLDANTSFNALCTKGISSVAQVSGTHTESPGFPVGAYSYGTVVTLNPGKITSADSSNHWGTVQIYIPDLPTTNGVYFRTRLTATWCKFSGTGVNPKTEGGVG